MDVLLGGDAGSTVLLGGDPNTIDRSATLATAVVERIAGPGYDAGLDRDLLAWEPSPSKRPVELTVENRGVCVRLRRYERLTVLDTAVGDAQRGTRWYGSDYRYVELRVWHDGSVTVEHADWRD